MYTLSQQVFALSMLVGSEDGQKGTAEQLEQGLQSAIADYLANAQLQALIGDGWSQAWGPVVWQASGSDVADNAMVVFSNAGGSNGGVPAYVVGIAGTNPVSSYDFDVEDLKVNPLVPWTYTLSQDAQIATGTNTGLQVLLNDMTDPQTKQSLGDYLAQVPGDQMASAQLIFAGHSLGGALAPVLALALFAPGGSLSPSWNTVMVQSTAGPTPGDQALIDLFASTFPSQSSGFNTLIWNSLDLVPHAWAPSTFSAGALDGIYAPNLAASPCIQTLVAALTTLPPDPNPYVQLPNSGAFAGTFQSHWFADKTCEYLAQVIYQHINAYYEQLAPELIPIINPLNPFSAKGQAAVGYICGKVKSAFNCSS